MPRFLRWSSFGLRTKGLIAVSLSVLPLICFWLIIALTSVQRETPTNTGTRSLVVQSALADIFSALLEADGGARDHLLTDNVDALNRYRAAVGRLPGRMAELDDAIIDPELRKTLQTLTALVDDELVVLRSITGGPAAGTPPLSERPMLDRSVEHLERIRQVAALVEQGQATLAAAEERRRGQSAQALLLTFLVGSILCVGGGFFAAVVTSDGVSRRIGVLARNTERLARGEDIKRVPTGADEIAQLDAQFRKAARQLREREAELQRFSDHQRRLNTALQARTSELEHANQELDAFSYSVSHDLRAPLRAIDGFSQMIEEDYEGRLDEPGRVALRRVRAAAQRMGTLIDKLLTLSRLTRLELKREPIDLGATADGILADLARQGPVRAVDVRVEPNLLVDADPNLVRIALQNLLDNAWKYTGKTERPCIEIGSSPNGAARVFHVRDNGAGFNMTYAGKLFQPFQRLHSSHDFDGTGVGLATVQRIVRRHGGRIWAEGAVGCGATFYFTLEPESHRSA